MAEMPELTEVQIRKWVGKTNAAKGKDLFEQGRINDFDLDEENLSVEGSVRGEDRTPFQVEISCHEDGSIERSEERRVGKEGRSRWAGGGGCELAT